MKWVGLLLYLSSVLPMVEVTYKKCVPFPASVFLVIILEWQSYRMVIILEAFSQFNCVCDILLISYMILNFAFNIGSPPFLYFRLLVYRIVSLLESQVCFFHSPWYQSSWQSTYASWAHVKFCSNCVLPFVFSLLGNSHCPILSFHFFLMIYYTTPIKWLAKSLRSNSHCLVTSPSFKSLQYLSHYRSKLLGFFPCCIHVLKCM